MGDLNTAAVGPVTVDLVNHPPHYTKGSVECIDALQAALGDDGFISYCNGAAIKYLWRWRHKHAEGGQDLRKAQWYITEMLRVMEGGYRA